MNFINLYHVIGTYSGNIIAKQVIQIIKKYKFQKKIE